MTYDGRSRVVVMAEAAPGAIDLVMRDLPALQPDEALVKVHCAGICGTDLHIIRWDQWAANTYRPPFALGHEFCGEVVDVGAAGTVKIGDRVTAETHLACGDCAQCRKTRGHTCDRLVTFSRLDRGAFADYTVVPVRLLHRVPAGLPDRIGAIMEPLGIAVRCATEAGAGKGSLLVSGCGPIGLMAIAAAKALGTHTILASDIVPARRRMALAMGAAAAVDPAREDLRAVAAAHTQGAGVDFAIETSGNGRALAQALASTAKGGAVVTAGLPSSDIPIDVAGQIVLREVALKGVYGRKLEETWQVMEDLLGGALNVEAAITDCFPLEEFRTAIDRALSAEAGKVLFQM